MIKRLITKYNIRFKKENRVKVLFMLPFLLLLEKCWNLRKKLLGINKPVIHLYAVCWNEARILPFMLDYYAQFVDHFYIYDNYSDDETDAILRATPNMTVRKFDTGGQFNDLEHMLIKNRVWKESRGKADWVIVIDMDELLYVNDPKNISKLLKGTIINTTGYNMISDNFPANKNLITEQVKFGYPDEKYSKTICFNPNRIVETNYKPGAHEIYPEGIVLYEKNTSIKLLHFKYLGIEYLFNRVTQYRARFSKTNIENKWGVEYFEEDIKIKNEFERIRQSANQIIE